MRVFAVFIAFTLIFGSISTSFDICQDGKMCEDYHGDGQEAGEASVSDCVCCTAHLKSFPVSVVIAERVESGITIIPAPRANYTNLSITPPLKPPTAV